MNTPSLWTTPEEERQHLAVLLAHAGRCQDLVERIIPMVHSPLATAVLRACREIGTSPAVPSTATLIHALRNNCPLHLPMEAVVQTGAGTEPTAVPNPASAVTTCQPVGSRVRRSPAEVAALERQHAYLAGRHHRQQVHFSNLLTSPPSATLLGRIRHRVDLIDETQALEAARQKIRQQAQRLPRRSSGRIDFAGLNAAAAPHVQAICERLLPGGEMRGNRYFALNPTRVDHNIGSFSVEVVGEQPGHWIDWAVASAYGDLIDLIAYLGDESKSQAVHHLRSLLGFAPTNDATGRYAPVTTSTH